MREGCTQFEVIEVDGQKYVDIGGQKVPVAFTEPGNNGLKRGSIVEGCVLETINAPGYVIYCAECKRVVHAGKIEGDGY